MSVPSFVIKVHVQTPSSNKRQILANLQNAIWILVQEVKYVTWVCNATMHFQM